ncbi:hypothetical protein BP6252_02388 [Coleophoma cylindrospora]|uniref:Uncharacterized protein n=1 Tax=Coleophoma cylindrospora TaxID=1849047 RepID=A0A3D8SGB1_9HELO|nr:hypothetical protein BP6252_02388 [Coleophoma cylindrospora]
MRATTSKSSLQSLLLCAISLSTLPIVSAAPAISLDSLPAGTVVRLIQLGGAKSSERLNTSAYIDITAPYAESEGHTVTIGETKKVEDSSSQPKHSLLPLDADVESHKYVTLMKEIQNRQMAMGRMGHMNEIHPRDIANPGWGAKVPLKGQGEGFVQIDMEDSSYYQTLQDAYL